MNCGAAFLFSEDILLFALHRNRESTAEFGAGYAEKSVNAKDLTEIYQWPLRQLANPKILNQVVGGLLTIDIDGEENLDLPLLQQPHAGNAAVCGPPGAFAGSVSRSAGGGT